MKSSTVWHGHSIRRSLPAGTARQASGSLPRGRQSRLIISPEKKNRAFPTGNALLYISLSYVDFSGCVRVGAPCFCFAFNFLTHGFRPPACMICYRLVAGSVIFSISSNVGIAGIAPWRLVVMLAALLAKARMPSSLSTVRVFSSSFQSLDRAAPKKVSPAPLVSPTLQGTPATWPVFSPKR